MKIILVTDTFTPVISGVVTVVKEYARALSSKHGIIVLAPNQSKRSQRFKDNNIDYILAPSIKNPVRKDHRIPLSSYSFIAKALKHTKPDIVHIHIPGILGLLALLAARFQNVPVVATAHGVPEFVTSYSKIPMVSLALYKLLWSYYNWFYNKTNAVIAPSGYIKEQLKNHGVSTQIKIVPMWIEPLPASQMSQRQIRSKLNISNDASVFLYFGRVDPDKNLELLVDAFASIFATYNKKVHLLLVGEGLSKHELQSRISRLNLLHAVSFLGHIPKNEIAHVYRAADAFVMLGKYEAQSLVTLQAIYQGVPCILVKAGALPEIAERFPDQCAVISPNISDLVAAMKQWTKEGVKKQKRFASRFSVLDQFYSESAVLNTLVALYKRLA